LKIKKYGIFLPKEECMVSRQPISKSIREYNGLNLVSADLRKPYASLPRLQFWEATTI
jgi:hypothetical protein